MGSGDQRATEGEIRAMFRNQSFDKKTEETTPETELSTLNLDPRHNYRSALDDTSNLLDLRDVSDADFCEKPFLSNYIVLPFYILNRNGI